MRILTTPIISGWQRLDPRLAFLVVSLSLFSQLMYADITLPKDFSRRPNIVYILVDDLGFGDLKVLNADSKIVTPSIDRLAHEGIVFSDAHSSAPVCAPSRYAALTGNYSFRGGDEWGKWRYYGVKSQILPEQWTLGDILELLSKVVFPYLS